MSWKAALSLLQDVLVSKGTSFAYAKLPRAGLGNMLLVWARARVFATVNRLPLMASPWARRFAIGPYLRRERSKRRYEGGFDPHQELSRIERLYALRVCRRVHEPPCSELERAQSSTTYVFDTVPHWSDYFRDLKAHRDLVRDALFRMTSAETLASLSRLPAPVVGMHVRMGDYRKLSPGTDFAKVGTTRTPLGYFAAVIRTLRSLHGSELPVTLFSDGHDHELAELLGLPGVTRAPRAHDLVEMLLLAKSRVVVCSAGSTFGYWSAFLADAPVIMHPDHIHQTIRPASLADTLYEGPAFDPSGLEAPPLLLDNLRRVRP